MQLRQTKRVTLREKGGAKRGRSDFRAFLERFSQMPRACRYGIEVAFALLLVVFLSWGCKELFYLYFKTNPQFQIADPQVNVVIRTGKMLSPEVVLEKCKLYKGRNLFSTVIEDVRTDFLQVPTIRDITITREMPNKIYFTILEREPLARVKERGWVVDEEGVVFVRYVGTGNLPLIRLSDEYANVEPGDRLHNQEMAAVRVVKSMLRPECKYRILELDARTPDFLLLTFQDFRRAKFAWEGMLKPNAESDARMQMQLDRLAQSMESDIGRGRTMWYSTQPDRMYAMPVPAAE